MPITPPENAALFLLCGKKYSPETGSSKNGSDTFKAIGAPSRKNAFISGRRFICTVCDTVQEIAVMTDSASYNVPADNLFFCEGNNKNYKCKSCEKILVGYFATHFL